MPNTLPLAGRTALITGAAKRVGRSIVQTLAEAGADIVLHYRTSADEAEQAARETHKLGRKAWCVRADLAEPKQTAGLVALASEAASAPVNILVNNASIFPSDTIMDLDCQDVLKSVQIHALAPLVLARALVENLGIDPSASPPEGQSPLSTPVADVVNLLDSRVTDYDRQHASYHLGKRMLLTITRMLALEIAPAVKVNAVAPGLILPPEGKDESYIENLAHTNPLCRIGSVQGVASAVRYLVESDFITGQIIYIDGGRHIKGHVYG